jgi:hypothetical protein
MHLRRPVLSDRIAMRAVVWLVCLPLIFAFSANNSFAAVTPSGTRVVDLSGHAVEPLADAKAKAIVLVFTRIDCPISNRYAPVIHELYRRFGPRGVSFWLIFVGPHESLQEVRQHVEEYRYKTHVALDRRHLLVKVAGAHVTPEVAVFSPQAALLYHGRIDNWYVSVGEALPAPTHNDLELTLNAILAGRPLPEKATPAVGCYISDLE